MSKIVCSSSSIKRFIKLWLSLKETPYWFHQSLSLSEQIEDFKVAKAKLEKLFDAIEVEMAKKYDMGAVYIMGRQGNMRVHFHVVFLFYGTPTGTPEELGAILRREVWKRWLKLNKGLNPRGNLLKIQTKPNGLWYLLTNHASVGKTTKEKGKPNWFGIRNKPLIEANSIPVLIKDVKARFDEFFPVIEAAIPSKPKSKFYSKRQLADLKAHVEADGRYEWEDFKQSQTRGKRKVSDADFTNFLNGQSSITPPANDGNTL